MLEASFPSILRLAEKPGRQDQDPVGQDHHLHGIGDWLGTQDLPKLAMDILNLARLAQKMAWPAEMVLVGSLLQQPRLLHRALQLAQLLPCSVGEVRTAQNSVQELGELVKCPLPAEVAMSFPQRSGKVLSCSQHVGILGNFLQESRQSVASGVASSL